MASRLLLLVAVVGLGVGLVSGGVALFHAWRGAAVDYVDATPSEVWGGTKAPSGSAVWLRGMRDEAHPVTLADGRVLYPTRSEPRVMVDCRDTGCSHAPVGRVEDLTLEGPPPASWPDGVGRRARVVLVGEPSDDARRTMRIAGLISLATTTASLACAAGAAVLYARRRRVRGAAGSGSAG